MVAAVVAIGLLSLVRQPIARSLPPKIPADQAKAWMADCLPGVGPKSRERVAQGIRERDLSGLPPAARGRARVWFGF